MFSLESRNGDELGITSPPLGKQNNNNDALRDGSTGTCYDLFDTEEQKQTTGGGRRKKSQ